MAHTPGPWTACGKGWDCRAVVEDSRGHYLVLVGPERTNPKVTNDVAEANAHLISAAPELYDEARRLRKLLNDLESACIQATERGAMMVHIGDLRQITKAPALDAAIAKAEGR